LAPRLEKGYHWIWEAKLTFEMHPQLIN
jgi:hypothetical protein